MRLCLAAAFLSSAAPALAHDQWANGNPVPGWIKSACCGVADAHHLRPDQVAFNARGEYVVEGYHAPLDAKFALPSQDGEYWIFYREYLDGSQSAAFCFFVPMNFKGAAILSAQTFFRVVCDGAMIAAGLTPAEAQSPNLGRRTAAGNGPRVRGPRPTVAASPMAEAERRRERAMSLGVGTDFMTAAPMIIIGAASGSLTLLADAMRGSLLTLLEFFAYLMLRRIHRGRLPSYQYGCGKIESFLNVLIGAALVLSSVWVFAMGVVNLIEPPQPRPIGLAAATAIAAINAAQNAWMFVTFLRARQVGASILIDGQVRTRLLKLVSSIIATLAILVSAMFAGQISGRVSDLVGSAVVVQMMLWTAYQLIAGALPDLMDRMLDPSLLTLVNRVLLCNFDRIDAIHHVRTRRSGVMKYIEIGVGFSADRRIGEIDAINQSLKKELEAQIPDAKVTIVASAAPL